MKRYPNESNASWDLRFAGLPEPKPRPYVCRCGRTCETAEDLAGHLSVSNTSHGDATPAGEK